MTFAGKIVPVHTVTSLPCATVFDTHLYVEGSADIGMAADYLIPAWVIPTTTVEADANLIVNTSTVEVQIPIKPIALRYKLTIYTLVPRDDIIGKKNVVLRRKMLESEAMALVAAGKGQGKGPAAVKLSHDHAFGVVTTDPGQAESSDPAQVAKKDHKSAIKQHPELAYLLK